MCGIDSLIRFGSGQVGVPHILDKSVKSRGPDAVNSVNYLFDNGQAMLHSSTLHLRGSQAVMQPLQDDRFILQWNGEIYDGLCVGQDENDTFALFKELHHEGIFDIFSKIQGEYAFVIIDKQEQRLYYGRDYFGRRSLLFHENELGIHLISVWPSESNSGTRQYAEVPAEGIYKIDLLSDRLHSVLIPWDEQILLRPVIRISKTIEVTESLDVIDEQFVNLLKSAVTKRVFSIPDIITPLPEATKLSILFSGGVDSLLLAMIADSILPDNISINLINVAFENERFLVNAPAEHIDRFMVPDRVSGIEAFREVKRLTKRAWTFVRVDVSREQYNEHRGHVKQLMRPSTTIMDLSIAIAIWFAARSQGKSLRSGLPLDCANAKVILVGMGADEQLAGYSRHRGAYERAGYPALLKELQLEVDRISSRNLGRDDRIISDHGREARFPFLDETLVNYLAALPLKSKCDMSLPRGYGEKTIIRRALKAMGFSDGVAYLPKRAIQFGAKTAKIENSKDGKESLE